MSRFGWAYVNSLITGAVANGPTNSIQFNSGSQVLSGSSNFTFDTSNNNVLLTGSLLISSGIISGSTGRFGVITGSILSSSNQIQVAGTSYLNSDVIIAGNIIGSQGLKAGYSIFATNFTASAAFCFIGVDSTSAVITASLNAANNYPAGQILIFKDIGNASINNILIKPSGSQTIDGGTGVIISTASGSVTLVSNGSSGFYITGIA